MNTISPNMQLPIPTVGQEPGPTYATDVNSALTLIDQHNHTPGNGVQIPPAGLNINSSLTFQNNFATNLAGLTLTAQTSTPADFTVYANGSDLYFVDGVGNVVRITQSGAVAGTPGSIANLTSPASASYVSASSTFVWESNTGIAANMDAGAYLFRNLSPNSTNAVTLMAPAALSSSYTITLPAVPSVTNIMTMDSSGNMATVLNVDAVTLIISSNQIKIANGGVGPTQLAPGAALSNIGANGITIGYLATTIPGISLNAAVYSQTTAGTYTYTVPTNVTRVIVEAVGGGGGGGGGGNGGDGTDTKFNGIIVGPGAQGCRTTSGGNATTTYGSTSSVYPGGASTNQAGQGALYAGGAGGSPANHGGGGGASDYGPGGAAATGGPVTGSPPPSGSYGAGGGGGTSGGGGAGCKKFFTVFEGLTPGASITVIVGAAGAGNVGNGAGLDGAIFIHS